MHDLDFHDLKSRVSRLESSLALERERRESLESRVRVLDEKLYSTVLEFGKSLREFEVFKESVCGVLKVLKED